MNGNLIRSVAIAQILTGLTLLTIGLVVDWRLVTFGTSFLLVFGGGWMVLSRVYDVPAEPGSGPALPHLEARDG